MKPEIIAILSIFIAIILAEIIFTRFFQKDGQVKGDGIVELIGTLAITLFTQPKILLLSYALGLTLVPQYQNALATIPLSLIHI